MHDITEQGGRSTKLATPENSSIVPLVPHPENSLAVLESHAHQKWTYGGSHFAL